MGDASGSIIPLQLTGSLIRLTDGIRRLARLPLAAWHFPGIESWQSGPNATAVHDSL
jgi:hypothetical protein